MYLVCIVFICLVIELILFACHIWCCMFDLESVYESYKLVVTLCDVKSSGSVLFSLDSECSCLILFACLILCKTEYIQVMHAMWE